MNARITPDNSQDWAVLGRTIENVGRTELEPETADSVTFEITPCQHRALRVAAKSAKQTPSQYVHAALVHALVAEGLPPMDRQARVDAHPGSFAGGFVGGAGYFAPANQDQLDRNNEVVRDQLRCA